ncbi:MAG: hypothetical protein ABL962_11685 [Fimbriimonadaceae bacterium]
MLLLSILLHSSPLPSFIVVAKITASNEVKVIRLEKSGNKLALVTTTVAKLLPQDPRAAWVSEMDMSTRVVRLDASPGGTFVSCTIQAPQSSLENIDQSFVFDSKTLRPILGPLKSTPRIRWSDKDTCIAYGSVANVRLQYDLATSRQPTALEPGREPCEVRTGREIVEASVAVNKSGVRSLSAPSPFDLSEDGDAVVSASHTAVLLTGNRGDDPQSVYLLSRTNAWKPKRLALKRPFRPCALPFLGETALAQTRAKGGQLFVEAFDARGNALWEVAGERVVEINR